MPIFMEFTFSDEDSKCQAEKELGRFFVVVTFVIGWLWMSLEQKPKEIREQIW